MMSTEMRARTGNTENLELFSATGTIVGIRWRRGMAMWAREGLKFSLFFLFV